MEHIPFVDLKKQYSSIKEEIDEALVRVAQSGHYLLGEETQKFEAEFAAYCGCKYGVAVDSGTAALHLALLACGVGPGDEVITVANTFIATALAISYTGANPVFVDIDENTMLMDSNKIECAITEKTRAIIPVHLYGQTADMDMINAVAQKHNLFVIEDACQAHGALYKGGRAGSLGDIGCFSFYPTKNLGGMGDGGAVVTNDYKLSEQLRMFGNMGQRVKYEHDVKGFNYRMDEIQAGVLRVKLRYLDKWNNERKRIASVYLHNIVNKYITFLSYSAGSVFHLFVLRSQHRDMLQEYLLTRGVQTAIHYPIPIHTQTAYSELVLGKYDLANTERFCKEIISLPIYTGLEDKEIENIIESINNFGG